jgi:hypothetical protein
MKRCNPFFATLVALALGASTALAQTSTTSPLQDPSTGSAQLKSIEAINFGPAGLLLIGDGKGKQVVAIDTGDTTPIKWTRTEMANIVDELAGRLGVTAKDIKIRKISVNPASQTAYIAVQSLAAKKDIILTVDGNGKVKEFSTDNVKFRAFPLPADQMVKLVTDIAWAGDRIVVATQASTATFQSKIFSIMAPLGKETSCGCISTETFHTGHNAWETNAPLRTMVPYEENGKKFLMGSFTCTPIVRYALDDIQAGAKVTGTSVVELGQGNTPQSMFVYEKGGKKYVLMNNMRMEKMQSSNPVGPSQYWTAKVDFDLLKETKNVNKDALWRTKAKANVSQTERATVANDYHGVTHMDQLDGERALVIRTDVKGTRLQVLPLP